MIEKINILILVTQNCCIGKIIEMPSYAWKDFIKLSLSQSVAEIYEYDLNVFVAYKIK